MNAIQFVSQALASSRGWGMGLLMDMQETPLVQPTSNGGNHPMWVLGHLVLSESTLLDQFILGQPNRFPELQEKFGIGSQPTTDPADYPSFGELLAHSETIRAAVMEYVGGLTEEDLDKATHAPAEFGEGFSTVGGCLTAMCSHFTFHAGQVSDARRAAGKGPLMA
jgi:hypothetical protein